jgi:hypothetical protein
MIAGVVMTTDAAAVVFRKLRLFNIVFPLLMNVAWRDSAECRGTAFRR